MRGLTFCQSACASPSIRTQWLFRHGTTSFTAFSFSFFFPMRRGLQSRLVISNLIAFARLFFPYNSTWIIGRPGLDGFSWLLLASFGLKRATSFPTGYVPVSAMMGFASIRLGLRFACVFPLHLLWHGRALCKPGHEGSLVDWRSFFSVALISCSLCRGFFLPRGLLPFGIYDSSSFTYRTYHFIV